MCEKIAVEKGRPSSQVTTGRSLVTFTAGASESDHSGMKPVKFHLSQTCGFNHPESPTNPAGVYLYLPVAGSRPAFFHRYIFAPSLLDYESLPLYPNFFKITSVQTNIDLCEWLLQIHKV